MPMMHRRRGQAITVARIGPLDLLREGLAGLVQRPARSALTLLGTLLGVGAFVTVLGLTTTAGGQIDQSFNEVTATTVTVTDAGTGNDLDTAMSFARDARQRVDRLNGVIDAGISFTPPVHNPTLSATPPLAQSITDQSAATGLTLTAVDPGIFDVTGATVTSGRVWDSFAQTRREKVAVLGSAAAEALGISRLSAQPVVFVNDQAYTVIGILADFQRDPELAAAIMIPTSTALAGYGPPTAPRATMLIETKLGAAPLIARQAARALRPDNPHLFNVAAPANPGDLKRHVTTTFNGLFLLLAAISLLIGAVGIANTTLVAVLERTGEIGLRRALGARPRHIAAQFLVESVATGSLGALIGTALAVATIVGTAISKQWTPIIQPWTVVAAPGLGAIVGVLAGLYPALRAARIQPADALRR
jgi:putative ABC transport system permease protein